ncbi:cell wall-associated NlpC family hydrolase [Saonia flava]|uniref:Cell wall-associated NlpC family hydrolase n=1 Tax=Saonia flava TaxID=523696 RepID=A0A846QY75_9FLAO|nr:C40 family peptidase [Saonia flava]NJB71890.1 cell wall-associated NlpC family hydrolase [Saonia flava]
MIRKSILFSLILLLASSCFVKKKTTYGKQRKITVEASPENRAPKEETTKTSSRKNTKADNIISTALTFTGVKYRYGGTTRKGMDCSGLLYVAFNEHDVAIPRVSYVMANKGRQIKVKNVDKGDLLFFKTSKKGKKINHVGLVVAVDGKDIKFIHSTTSRGVIVSSLREGYWNYAFVKATRVL